MTTIDQLIHDLWCCANDDDCNKCSYVVPHRCKSGRKLQQDAAAALNLLQAELAALNLLQAELAALKEQMRWRDATKELPPQPEPNKELEGKPLDLYLVAFLGEFPFRAFWNGKSFSDGIDEFEPDFWQPLPELPEEVE